MSAYTLPFSYIGYALTSLAAEKELVSMVKFVAGDGEEYTSI